MKTRLAAACEARRPRWPSARLLLRPRRPFRPSGFPRRKGEPAELRSADTTRVPVRVVEVHADAGFD
jgi:hypothetical protein